MDKQIVVGGKTLSLTPSAFNGAVKDTWSLTGVRVFVAEKVGITLPVTPKGEKGISFADVKKLAVKHLVSQGKTDEQANALIKQYGKDYDESRGQFKTVSKQIMALAVADDRMTHQAKPVFGKNGFIGVNVRSRIDRSVGNSAGKDATIAKLQAQLDALQTKLAALPA